MVKEADKTPGNRAQGRGAMTPQKSEPDLPVNVWESPAEAWINSCLSQGQGHWQQQSGRRSMLS